ncbi:MAG TPA: LysR family transcriptional regulator [Xanthobacteraceae bacterium]|jgi:DNA-binding transcriptional LysR family regulator|nr:LysR family transcriptional regulator [Xanthobacteraceae bacterium]
MDVESLDLKKLRAFHLVARHGNLRLAASRLNQTVPAISSKLRRLEEDLGIELFERLPNKLILTAAGEKFLREVDAVFERVEQAIATLSSGTTPGGRLAVSIGTDHSWYSAPKISNFLKRFPGVELRLQVYRASDALRALARGELDVSIGVFPKLPKALEREVIAESSLSLVCMADDPLLRRQPPKLADIARHRLIVLPRHAETRKLLDKAMANGSIQASSIIEAANCQTAATFVEMGVGVAIVHTLCMGHHHARNLRCVDLGQHFGKIAFSVVYRRGGLRSPLIRGLLEEMAFQ